MKKEEKYSELLLEYKTRFKNNNKKNDIISVLLFRNYLTSLFLLKKELNNDSEFIKNLDSHNIFIDLNPSWLNQMISVEAFYSDLRENQIEFSTGRFLKGYFLYLYTYWEMYKDTDEIKALNNNNIYISLIKIFERIKDIYVYSGQFQIGEFTFKNNEKYKGYKLPSVEDNFLNYLERKCIDIPNQEETDSHWEDFNRVK